MVTEVCPNCNNTVVGQFNPSKTRAYLTGLAKTGGMKAVLATVGSVVPGFGNIGGFLAGGAIDLIYGKDIKKLIDKVADLFDDNKVYVFDCPNCGQTWSRQEENLVTFSQSYDANLDNASIDEMSPDNVSNEEVSEEMIEQFMQDLSFFLDNSEQINQTYKTTSDFMTKMYESSKNSSSRMGAAYHFLAALAGLFFLMDTDDEDIRWKTKSQIKQALYLSNADEYLLIETLLQIQTSKEVYSLSKLIRKATACKIDNNYSWLKKEYYQKSLVPDVCFWKVNDMVTKSTISDEDKIELWKSLVNSPVADYRMFANLQIYWKLSGSDESAYSFLLEAFNTKGFSLRKIDIEDVMYQKWLGAAEEYAECLYSGVSNKIGHDKHRGLEMLHTIADLGTYEPCLWARKFLGELAEKDGNIHQALTYYITAGEIASDEAMRVRKLISDTTDSPNSSAKMSKTSSEEEEYLSEVKACLEDGGSFSKGERRLLEKLRIKLSITEERAAELEQLVMTPELTEEEKEYISEYEACLAEDGVISASERRLLNRLRDKLGISEERAVELENL